MGYGLVSDSIPFASSPAIRSSISSPISCRDSRLWQAVRGFGTAADSQTLTFWITLHRYIGKGLIQIWDMGILQDGGWATPADEPRTPLNQPAMVLGIMHESACVWDLKWCPSRTSTWDLPDGMQIPLPNGEDKDMLVQDRLPRLGLLAAAFADGSIKIFSVPHPAGLKDGRHFLTIRFKNQLSLIWCSLQYGSYLHKTQACCRVHSRCEQSNIY